MIPKNTFKEKIKNMEKTAGYTISMNDPIITEMMGHVGFDYLWIDTEHGPIDYHSLELLIMGCEAGGTASLVRVPWNDQVMVKRVLDLGPTGIIFPMILTPEDADYAMRSCLYPPIGIRGYGPSRAVRWGAYPPLEYIAGNEENVCRFVQIEDIRTVQNLPEIIKNPYIDGYIFGPCDMSGSIGELFNYKGKNTQDVFREAARILHENNKYFGVCVGAYDVEGLEVWREMDIPMITSGSDSMGMVRAAREALSAIKTFQNRQ